MQLQEPRVDGPRFVTTLEPQFWCLLHHQGRRGHNLKPLGEFLAFLYLIWFDEVILFPHIDNIGIAFLGFECLFLFALVLTEQPPTQLTISSSFSVVGHKLKIFLLLGTNWKLLEGEIELFYMVRCSPSPMNLGWCASLDPQRGALCRCLALGMLLLCPACSKRSLNLSWISWRAPILHVGLHCKFSIFSPRLIIRWFVIALQGHIKLDENYLELVDKSTYRASISRQYIEVGNDMKINNTRM